MIRRDARLADGSPAWMLISQVEHARVSEQLARHCTAQFSPAVRAEVLAAIGRHDDGWAEWERQPALDPKHRRPLSFNELTPAEATPIWTRSVDAAARVGPLAASMVAGHFARLTKLFGGDDQHAAAWQEAVEERRRAWLDQWTQSNPVLHTPAIAAEALQWLWTFDEVSLWLCCTCMPGESIPCSGEPYRAGRGTPLEMELSVVGAGRAIAHPWWFDATPVEISIDGTIVPVARYRDSAELLAAAVPYRTNWRLTEPLRR